MEKEYVVIALIRLGVLLFSFLTLPPGVFITKKAWVENDYKKLKKGIYLIWGSIIAACIFLKLVRGLG